MYRRQIKKKDNESSPRVLRAHFSSWLGGPGENAKRQKYWMIDRKLLTGTFMNYISFLLSCGTFLHVYAIKSKINTGLKVSKSIWKPGADSDGSLPPPLPHREKDKEEIMFLKREWLPFRWIQFSCLFFLDPLGT